MENQNEHAGCHPRVKLSTTKQTYANGHIWCLVTTTMILLSPSWNTHQHHYRSPSRNNYHLSFGVVESLSFISQRPRMTPQKQKQQQKQQMHSLPTPLKPYSSRRSFLFATNYLYDGENSNSSSTATSMSTTPTLATRPPSRKTTASSSSPSSPSASSYRFWEEPMTTQSFNMDLQNIAMEDAQKAQDALEIMSEKYETQQQDNHNHHQHHHNHHHQHHHHNFVKPNTASYTTVIEGWLNSPIPEQNRNAAYQIQYLLDTMEQSDDPDIQPNAVTYMLACQAWAENTNDRKTGYAPQKAERMLQKMKQKGFSPNVKVYTSIVNAWCRVSGNIRGAMSHVEQLLNEMETLSSSNTTSETSLATTSSATTTTTAATTTTTNHTEGATAVVTNVGSDSTIKTNALSRSSKADQIEWHEFPDGVATAVIPQFGPSNKRTRQHGGKSNRESVRPNVITYTAVIGGYARSKERNLATKAEAILERMERNGVVPDMVAYTSVLNAWSKATSYHERKVSAKKSLAIIDKMERLYIEEEQYHMKPNPITYAACINGIGNSLDWNSGTMAEDVLRRMYDLSNTTIPSVKPQTNTYNAVITAYARNTNRKNGRMNAQKAESLLVEMTRRSQQGEVNIQPNVRTWSGVMSAWAGSGENAAAINAQRVLDNLEQLHDMGRTIIRPNCVCFTTVMSAWSTSRRPDAVSRAEQLLFRMEKRFLETGDKDVRPNAITYVTLINAFIKKNATHAGPKAQKTVNRMMRLYLQDTGFLKPSRMVFNSLINAWSKSEDPSSAKHAERILEWMERQYNDGDEYFKPDDVTFCGVLNAWANHAQHGGAHRAQQLLDHMEHMTTQERGFQQSIICYNIVIKAWARSGEPDAVQRGEQILKRLESNDRDDALRPDTTTYSSVINCCAYYNQYGKKNDDQHGKQEALRVAMTTFHKLSNSTAIAGGDDSVKPNHVTYGTLLKAINNLISPVDKDGRETLIRSIFAQCCQDGQVDTFVLNQLRNGCSTKTYRDLLQIPTDTALSKGSPHNNGRRGRGRGRSNVDTIVRQLPKEWSCNVPKYK